MFSCAAGNSESGGRRVVDGGGAEAYPPLAFDVLFGLRDDATTATTPEYRTADATTPEYPLRSCMVPE